MSAIRGPLVAVVDDDSDFRALVLADLEDAGFRCVDFPDGPSCLDALETAIFDAVLLDMSMPRMDGSETLRRIHEWNPFLPVVMLTADGSVDLVVQCMRAGAADYLVKPPGPNRIEKVLREVLERAGGAAHLARAAAAGTAGPFEGMFGRSAALQRVFQMMARTAVTDISVLILGESGTGKELVARGIHAGSDRRDGPFVAVNAAAIPDTLIEAELFGHEKGAFTGAQSRRAGKIEQANGGTLFLDEVGELPLPMQTKLLRVIQERTFQRLGGNESVRSDFRLLTATHRDLPGEVRAGRFREDLYFRIAVFELEVPPLRERRSDVVLLAQRFLEEYREASRSEATEISPEAVALLLEYDWPGNVRELQNAMQRALVLCEGTVILPAHLPRSIREKHGTRAPVAGPSPAPPAIPRGRSSLEEIERQVIEETVLRCGGNVSEAMRALKMGRNRFYRRLKNYGLMNVVEEARRAASAESDKKE